MSERTIRILEEGQGKLIQPFDLDEFRAHNRRKNKALVDKRLDEHEAIRRHIREGDYVGIELYGTVRCPMSLTRELIRQGFAKLRSAAQGVYEADLLAAANCITEMDWTYIGLEVYGVSNNLRRAVEGGYVKTVTEWSNAALAWRFKAAAMGVPFLPVRSMLGSDTLKYSAAKVIECPFTGLPICLIPALVLDVGIIHVNRSDKYGNCQIDGITGFAAEMARASKTLIVSAEQIVDESVIRAHPDRTIIPYYVVDAVVHAPFGSHPGEMNGLYERDEQHIRSYFEESKDPGKVKAYLDKWVYGVKDHEEYMNLVGRERLQALRIQGG
ncbi:MAG: CoA transferase subunit A [Myxococcales bacterium]|nr:MAG: CoA transferase subunit A [Myxococcales bacterium]